MNSLEDRCKKCRRRQIKCDMTKPTCLRCQKDGFICPGYTERLQIIAYRPPQVHRFKKSMSKAGQITSWEKQTASSVTSHIPSMDRDVLNVLEAVRGYNLCVAPVIRPSRHPFRQEMIENSVPWPEVPKLLQHLFIVMLQSMQTSRNGVDPLSQRDYCHYRGLCLSDIRSRLTETTADLHGLALVTVLMLMVADASLPNPDPWHSHFEAAARIMESRGGLDQSLLDIPDARVLFIGHMLTNIMTAPTCKSWSLNHQKYEILRPGLEKDIFLHHVPCPLALYGAILRINNLRLFQNDQTQLSFMLDSTAFEAEYGDLQALIWSFDAQTWAISVQQDPPNTLPTRVDTLDPRDTSGLISLALCYQASSKLYFLYALPVYEQQAAQESAENAIETLHKNLDRLFQSPAIEGHATLDLLLWKYSSWPIFISVYVMICWGVPGIDDSTARIDEQLNWLQNLATWTRSKRIPETIAYLRDLRNSLSPNARCTRSWDSGLPWRRLYF